MARVLGIQVYDELPPIEHVAREGGGRVSETVTLVQEVMSAVENGEIAVNAPVCIAQYDTTGGAAGGAGGLRKRYGPKEAYGLTFATRKVKNDDGSNAFGVFMLYDPSAKVPGEQAKQDEDYAEYNLKLKLQAQKRKAEKAAEA